MAAASILSPRQTAITFEHNNVSVNSAQAVSLRNIPRYIVRPATSSDAETEQ